MQVFFHRQEMSQWGSIVAVTLAEEQQEEAP